ncbi:hypothetical protein BGX38DRAFT_1163370 [Terfezia claveryi]|nr:hypothetical protein BGX38DRAFT_1163370 [Terfezia claveryi]
MVDVRISMACTKCSLVPKFHLHQKTREQQYFKLYLQANIHKMSVAPMIPMGISPGMPQPSTSSPRKSLASRYRGATIEDLDLAPALSITPESSVGNALGLSYDRDFSQLTVISARTRSLLGYLDVEKIKKMLQEGKLSESDQVSKAMNRFRTKGRVYKVITPDTPLEELDEFLSEDGREFAVVTDDRRRFVLGVATRQDLENFATRRPD